MKNKDYCLDRFLKLFDKKEVMKFKFRDGLHLYPLVRYKIIYYLFLNKYNLQRECFIKHTTLTQSFIKHTTLTQKINYLFQTILRNPFFSKGQYDIVMIGPTLSNTIIKDGKFFNRIYDYFNLLLPSRTIMLEESYIWNYYYPRYFNNIYYHDFLKAVSYVGSKVLHSYDISVINKFISFLQSQGESLEEHLLDELRTDLIFYLSYAKIYTKLHEKLFKKWKPKVIFIDDASYGSINSAIIKCAKEMGIKVGEFQHGIVTKAHLAYHYGDEIKNSVEYSFYTPDYFLTYGDYWNKQVYGPFKTITIGNPHFWEHFSAQRYKKRKINKKTILIVSQGTVTDMMVTLTKKLSKLLGNKYIIIFRLHPRETFKDINKKLYKHKNIKINKKGDIYKLIARSDFVVGVYSTTIFEAYCFGKPVFVLDCPISRAYIPKEIGIWFKTPEELAEKILNYIYSTSNNILHNINYFFDSQWKKNYLNFIHKIIIDGKI